MAKTPRTTKTPSPKKREPRRKITRKRKIDNSLSSVYGETPRKKKAVSQLRMARSRKKSRSSFIIVTLIITAFFAALSWVGFYFFSGSNTFNDRNISLSIDTPKNITSGDEISFTIHYRNNQKVALKNTDLRIKPPTGFILEKTEPKANGTNDYHFDLGTLKKNTSGKIIINGTFIGAKDGNHEITAFFTYRPENFNSDFEKTKNEVLNVAKSPLTFSTQGPDDVAAGAQATYSLELKNVSKNKIEGMKVVVTAPDQFVLSSMDPEQKNEYVFLIDSLEKKDTWNGSFVGSFKNSTQGEQTFTIENYIIRDEKEFLQNETKHFTNVTSPQLETTLKINDFQKKGSVAPGASFNAQLEVKNNGTSPMENVELVLEIETPAADGKAIVDWEALKKNKKLNLVTEDVADNRQRATITWNGENTKELVSLAPDTKNGQELQIPVLTPEAFGGILPGNTIIVQAKTSASGGPQSQTAPFEITLRSDTNITANITAAGDPVVGIGPDGLTEVSVRQYDLAITINNSLHEIIDLEILTLLAEDVIFEQAINVPAGELQFIPNKKTIRWTLNKLPLSVPELTYVVRIDTITPIGDVEKNELINNIQLTAIDAISDVPFKIKLGAINKR